MRLTPTRPSRTRSELSREGMVASCADHVGAGDPVVEPAFLAIESDPQEAEEQRREARDVAGAARDAATRRWTIAVDVDDLDLERAHAERAAGRDLEHQQVR